MLDRLALLGVEAGERIGIGGGSGDGHVHGQELDSRNCTFVQYRRASIFGGADFARSQKQSTLPRELLSWRTIEEAAKWLDSKDFLQVSTNPVDNDVENTPLDTPKPRNGAGFNKLPVARAALEALGIKHLAQPLAAPPNIFAGLNFGNFCA